MNWQPIESAPRDGTRILLLVDGNVVEIGFWGPKLSGGGVNYGDGWGYGVRWDETCEPTHWMPLPAPPKRQTR